MEVFGISVVHIALAILMSIFTSWITVKFALGKFQKEKLWERKLEAYEKIIESLYRIKKIYDTDYDDFIGECEKHERKYSEKELEERRNELKIALDEVGKFTEIGSLIISKGSVKILNQYKKLRLESDSEARKYGGDYFIFLDGITSGTKWCLEKIIPVAQKDLNNNSWKKLLDKLPSCCSCKN